MSVSRPLKHLNFPILHTSLGRSCRIAHWRPGGRKTESSVMLSKLNSSIWTILNTYMYTYLSISIYIMLYTIYVIYIYIYTIYIHMFSFVTSQDSSFWSQSCLVQPSFGTLSRCFRKDVATWTGRRWFQRSATWNPKPTWTEKHRERNKTVGFISFNSASLVSFSHTESDMQRRPFEARLRMAAKCNQHKDKAHETKQGEKGCAQEGVSDSYWGKHWKKQWGLDTATGSGNGNVVWFLIF